MLLGGHHIDCSEGGIVNIDGVRNVQFGHLRLQFCQQVLAIAIPNVVRNNPVFNDLLQVKPHLSSKTSYKNDDWSKFLL